MSDDQLQPQDTLDDRGVDDVLDEGYSPPERLRNSAEHETLDERLSEEEPEVWVVADEERDADILDGDVGGEVGSERTGRLMAPDEGSGEDIDATMYAEDEGIDGSAASVEEAAMHTFEE